MNGIDRIIRERRSVGKVAPDPIDPAVVRQLLELAVMAPNHHMHEPWRFVVVSGPARRRLGEAHAMAFAATHPQADQATLAREQAKFDRAPVVIACIVHPADADAVTLREDRDAVAAAIQNLLLAAHARGLGAMWRTGTMPDEAPLREVLELGASDAIVGFVYLGHPVVAPPTRVRRPVDEVTRWVTD